MERTFIDFTTVAGTRGKRRGAGIVAAGAAAVRRFFRAILRGRGCGGRFAVASLAEQLNELQRRADLQRRR